MLVRLAHRKGVDIESASGKQTGDLRQDTVFIFYKD